MEDLLSEGGLHCPHCGDPLATVPLEVATRCPTCRLIIGAGRAVTATRAQALGVGSSAGTRVNAARRAEAAPADPARIEADIVAVAERLDCQLARLRMIDYDAEVQRHPELVDLPQVLATFGSWKAARAAAGATKRPASSEAAASEPSATPAAMLDTNAGGVVASRP